VGRNIWIEVSIEATPEQVESVAEVISRYANQGVVIEQLASGKNSFSAVIQPLVKVFGYILLDDSFEVIRKKIDEAIRYLSQIQPIADPAYKEIPETNWMSAWKDQYRPLTIGKKIAVIPAWIDDEYPQRYSIRINPGMAFGTGTHPTTQLSMRLLEKYLETGDVVFDVGCGSGILSAGAIFLGASNVFGVDISPAAVASSKETAQLNHLGNAFHVARGSIEAYVQGQFGKSSADLVIANILTPILLRLFEQGLSDLVADDGYLILSGILSDQLPAIQHAARKKGLLFQEELFYEDWAVVCFQKEPASE